jgi:hypothetical protein
MAIIINEFEIIAPQGESPGGEVRPQPGRGQLETRTGGQPEPLCPEDIERILRRFYLRRTRLWAD